MSGFGTWVQNVQRSGPGLLLAYLLAGAAIYAIQLYPIPGIILMALAAPLWIGLLVHMAMLHFAWLAIRGPISMAWLALPIGFYAGGIALHLVSVRAAEAEAHAIDVRNAAVRLTVDQPFRYLREGNADSFALIEHYRVDRAFLRQGKGTITATYYARGADCDNALQGFYYQRRFEPWALRKDIFYNYHGQKTRQCVLSQDGISADWRYRIKASYTYDKDRASWMFTRRGKVFEVFDDSENQLLGAIEVATFTPFPLVPWIVAGCFLDDGASKWRCSWGLTKSGRMIAAGYRLRAADDPEKNPFTPSADPQTWEITQLARALGLDQRQPMD